MAIKKKPILKGIAALTSGLGIGICSYIYRPLFPIQKYPDSYELTLLQNKTGYQQEIYKGIVITGTKDYISEIKSSLDLIYNKDPENLNIVLNNITKITLNPPSGIDYANGRFTTNDNSGETETLEWVASEIIHDAWHREYWKRWEISMGKIGEKKCLKKQKEFLDKTGYVRIDFDKWEEYWLKKYEERNW